MESRAIKFVPEFYKPISLLQTNTTNSNATKSKIKLVIKNFLMLPRKRLVFAEYLLSLMPKLKGRLGHKTKLPADEIVPYDQYANYEHKGMKKQSAKSS